MTFRNGKFSIIFPGNSLLCLIIWLSRSYCSHTILSLRIHFYIHFIRGWCLAASVHRNINSTTMMVGLQVVPFSELNAVSLAFKHGWSALVKLSLILNVSFLSWNSQAEWDKNTAVCTQEEDPFLYLTMKSVDEREIFVVGGWAIPT